MTTLTASRLRTLLKYDPATGVFTRLVRTSTRIRVGDVAGRPSKKGYIRFMVDGETYSAHHLAWLYMMGRWPADQIDHRNNVRYDNKFQNLREATPTINAQNRIRAPRTNHLGLLGVQECYGGFRALIWTTGRNFHLGVFVTPEQAHAAYVRAKRQLHEGNTL